jgi:hypothetical protein
METTLKGLQPQREIFDATPSGLKRFLGMRTQGSSCLATLG